MAPASPQHRIVEDEELCELLSIQRWVNLEIAKAVSRNSAPFTHVLSDEQPAPRMLHMIHRQTDLSSRDLAPPAATVRGDDSKYIVRRII